MSHQKRENFILVGCGTRIDTDVYEIITCTVYLRNTCACVHNHMQANIVPVLPLNGRSQQAAEGYVF